MTTKHGRLAAVGRFAELPLARFMERDVQSARPDTKADVVASMMVEGFGSVPIVDEAGRLVGVVSEHDLLRSLHQGHQWGEVTVRDIMAPNPYAIRVESDLATLIEVLVASDLIRTPVVDAEGTLVGIVARRDIVRGYLNYGVDQSGRMES